MLNVYVYAFKGNSYKRNITYLNLNHAICLVTIFLKSLDYFMEFASKRKFDSCSSTYIK